MAMNEKLAELRKSKGLTQKELAEALNVTRQAVSRWEVGTAAPSLDNLAYLSRLYDIPMDDLVKDEDAGPSDLPGIPEEVPAEVPMEDFPVPAPADTRGFRPALVPLLLAILILGVGVLIGVSLRKEPKQAIYLYPRSEPAERVIVGGPNGWLEKTPADIEDEKRYLESGSQLVGYFDPSTGVLQTVPNDTSEETPTP